MPRAHSHRETTQPAGSPARIRSNRSSVPEGVPWSSAATTRTASASSGKYHHLGIGWLGAVVRVRRLPSTRICSSACGTWTESRSTQSGRTSPSRAPWKRSLDRIGGVPSRSCPAQAGFPCLVSATERARSKVNAETVPPARPTRRTVTPGTGPTRPTTSTSSETTAPDAEACRRSGTPASPLPNRVSRSIARCPPRTADAPGPRPASAASAPVGLNSTAAPPPRTHPRSAVAAPAPGSPVTSATWCRASVAASRSALPTVVNEG